MPQLGRRKSASKFGKVLWKWKRAVRNDTHIGSGEDKEGVIENDEPRRVDIPPPRVSVLGRSATAPRLSTESAALYYMNNGL